MKHRSGQIVFALAVLGYCLNVRADADKEFFDHEIAPLIASHCLDCHSGFDAKGQLNLSTHSLAIKGGDSGAALNARHPAQSLLLKKIESGEMPPEDRLNDEEKRILGNWIRNGAKWGTSPIDTFRFTTSKRAGYDWWALQPIRKPVVPNLKQVDLGTDATESARNPIDAFVLARLKESKLQPSPKADRRTLIRRLSFDMLGLPPSPDEVIAFVKDERPDAYLRLVQRLLDSHHYGERWARHWLDVARFGESEGFERDKLRENSWRYRDWVVDAFNDDMPYDEFVRMQLAGDVLKPKNHDAITATGFLVAGPYDVVGQNQQSAAMRVVVRQDELEDLVGTVSQTFLGLTANCARCHDHKFDPIRQKEYYQLTAAFAGVHHGERSITIPPDGEHGRLQVEVAELRRKLNHLEQRVRAEVLSERKPANRISIPQPIARWTFDEGFQDSIGQLHGQAKGNATVKDGHLVLDGKSYVATAAIDREIQQRTIEAWVRLSDLKQRGGGVVSIQGRDGVVFDAIVFGEREPKKWMAGSDGFVRYKSFNGVEESDATRRFVHVAIVYGENGQITGYRDGLRYGETYRSAGTVKYLKGTSQILFGLRHGKSASGGRTIKGEVDQAQLYDRALTAEEIAASAARSDYVSTKQLVARLSLAEQKQRSKWAARIQQVDKQLAGLKGTKTYAVVSRKPEPAHLLIRGNPAQKGVAVEADGIAALRGVAHDFAVSVDASDADRRKKLAEWVTSKNNPLFARVMVNRVWHYHFGAGLVATPNDFGFNAGLPSHPELLEWLAKQFVESGYSLKKLHTLIVTSATYQQTSVNHDSGRMAVDSENHLLSRRTALRLDAETLRDAVLTVSGQLNRQKGGPPYRDFKTFRFNSQFYEMIDPVGFEFNRRTLYRTWIRSGRNVFLDVFDCPDPSTTAPKRAVTTTPLQSLALMNNSFILRMSDRLAERVEKEAGSDSAKQVDRLYWLAYSREPVEEELKLLGEFISKHGLSAAARVVFNSNEFLYVD